MNFCSERNISCKPFCIGPVSLKIEEVGSVEGNSRNIMYDVVHTSVNQVCSLDIIDKIKQDDWVHDEADVTGKVFPNDPRIALPTRIVTITSQKGI